MKRPYLNLGISELEHLFDTDDTDRVRLRIIDAELRHRSTDRANRLRARVVAALGGMPGEEERSGAGRGQGELTLGATASQAAPPIPAVAAASANPSPTTTPDDEPADRIRIPTLDLDKLTHKLPPTRAGSPQAVLAAWTALEALAPQSYKRPIDLADGDPGRLARLDGRTLPWPDGKSRPGLRLYYQIPLGAIRMPPASDALTARFAPQEEFRRPQSGYAMIGAILIDSRGVPVEENPVAVSSFAWALPRAARGDLASLGSWPEVEAAIVQHLKGALDAHRARANGRGDAGAITAEDIDALHRWLVERFGLDASMVEAPSFAVRTYARYKDREDPAIDLLNSFYLHDLARARRVLDRGRPPDALARYLGLLEPADTRDLLNDRAAIEAMVAPARIPPARWPAPGGHSLVLLQQAAVNVVRDELASADGVVGINGPPGTGKTTLLRDVVAACILDRAAAMAAFANPKEAFRTTKQKVQLGGVFFQLYELDPSLKGHEVLIASSNNKAVENVSRELPGLDALAGDYRYFPTLSDRLAAGSPKDSARTANGAYGTGDGTPSPPETTWGAIAAVLGNGKNRAAFVQGFWWDPEHSMQDYLRAVQGKPPRASRDGKDGGGGADGRPRIVATEKPPSPAVAKMRWREARSAFQHLQDEVRRETDMIEALRTAIRAQANGLSARDRARQDHEAARTAEDAARHAHDAAETALQVANEAYGEAELLMRAHTDRKPGWIARLLGLRAYREWREEGEPLLTELMAARTRRTAAAPRLVRTEADLVARRGEADAARAALAEAQDQCDHNASVIEAGRSALSDRVVDAAYFDRGHKAAQLGSPWLPDALHAKREALFRAAMDVHRAFLDCAAQNMQHNLAILMSALHGASLGSPEKDALLPDLWATLFAVIPILSTTFASMDRMLGRLPPRSIGWLLVDEAGQAAPQQAVGAVMRARRAVVVGDPLQVPPVTALPDTLARAICGRFDIDAERWAAPAASAQTLADRASRYRAVFGGDGGPTRPVGAPLLVHRRCEAPMFGISNAIAYDDLMVFGTMPRTAGPVATALGPSRWIDVGGLPRGKWCPAGGEATVDLVRELPRAGVSDPDLFLITPFRDVAKGLRARFAERDGPLYGLDVDPTSWVKDRIGTIHTFQGREAEAVILVLGAPAPAQAGARMWATAEPNILNVAVSRAKQALYVVGSRSAWGGAGNAATMVEKLRG